jgi:hypothetical protein
VAELEGYMDHAEARELLELAAVEPNGFERLVAGDTADAAALAGHVAGCEACGDEMTRLRAASAVIRDIVRTTPPPELRDRTLAFVRELGRDRPGHTMSPTMAAAAQVAATVDADRTSFAGDGKTAEPIRIDRAGRTRAAVPPARWLAAIAAVLVVAVVGTGLLVQARNDATIKDQAAAVNGLSRVTVWYLGIESQPDARRIDLASTDGGPARGTVELTLQKMQLVVVATDVAKPSAGQELACWLEFDGQRHPIGRMFFGGGLAYWAGDVELPATIPAGARFGVSTPGGDPILIGQL